MAELPEMKTPVGVHFWNAVTSGVTGLNTFVQNSTARDPQPDRDGKLAWKGQTVWSSEWAKQLFGLRIQLDLKTTRTSAELVFKTLLQVRTKLEDWDIEYKESDKDRVYKDIRHCRESAKAFRDYSVAFTAFSKSKECTLRTYLAQKFSGHASAICTELGALETTHLTFREVYVHMNKVGSLKFLSSRDQKWALYDTVDELKRQLSTGTAIQSIGLGAQARLDCMRACLLGM